MVVTRTAVSCSAQAPLPIERWGGNFLHLGASGANRLADRLAHLRASPATSEPSVASRVVARGVMPLLVGETL